MITTAPCTIDKMTLKTAKRIINITRGKRACRPRGPSSIPHYPEVHWSLPSKTVWWAFAPIYRLVRQALICWFETRLDIFQQRRGGKTLRAWLELIAAL